MVNLLVTRLELHSPISLLSAALAVFLVRALARVFFDVVPQDLTLLCRIFGSVQHVFFVPSRRIAQTFCILSLVPAGASLLGVEWRGGYSSIAGPYMTSTVGILPVLVLLRRCTPFIYLFHGFHPIKNLVGLPLALGFKIPSL